MSDNAYVTERECATADLKYSAACIEAKVAEAHLMAATETLKHVKDQIDMRTVCIAQIAATLMTAADKLKGVSDIPSAVKVARAILAETEKPVMTITKKEPSCTTTESNTKTTTPTQSRVATSEKSTTTTTSGN